MANISLRGYNQQIETLIDGGEIDEAIAHCRHILKYFPKHLETYRLLGKAFLESQRYGDAADIFQRVLSSIPDDFVSQVGMSIVREDEGNLDAAIWHMERAFDVQPSNGAIQDELRRLYGIRDGMEPPKIRLTRGALARLYAHGDLYQQATAEIRATLKEQPDRLDLMVLLADMYHKQGQNVEAAEVCSQVLKKLPYCIEANRILVAVLQGTERKSEIEASQLRLTELDPYYARLPSPTDKVEDIEDQGISLPNLDYDPSLQVEQSQPEWAASLGVGSEEFDESDEEIPDWIMSASEESASEEEDWLRDLSPAGESESEIPETEEPPDWAAIASEEPSQDSEPLPDFMKEAGWESRDSDVEEEPPSIDFEESLHEEELDQDLAPAEIPDWLQSMAPESNEEEAPGFIEETFGEGPPDWLDDIEEEPSEVSEKPEAASQEEEPFPEAPQEPVFSEALSEEDEEIPDWLGELSEESDTQAVPQREEDEDMEEELPEWLVEETEPSIQEKTSASIEEEEQGVDEEVPDWLRGLEEEDDEELVPQAETSEPEEDLVELHQDFGLRDHEGDEDEIEAEEDIPTAIPEAETPISEEEIPEWLEDYEEDEEILETISVWLEGVDEDTGEIKTVDKSAVDETLEEISTEEEPLPELDETQPTHEATLEEGEGEPEVPARLEDLDVEAPAEVLESEHPEAVSMEFEEDLEGISAEEGIPDWLQSYGDEVSKTEEAEPADIEPPLEEAAEVAMEQSEQPEMGEEEFEMPDLEDEDAAMAWLESLAAKQGAQEEELLTKPEDRLETPPEWVQEIETPTGETEQETIEAEFEPETIPQRMEEEVPFQEEEEPIQEEFADEARAEKIGEMPDLEEMDEDEALAWLEGLAAKQGVSEEELLTSPETRQEEPPEWTLEEEEVPTEEEVPEEMTAQVPEEELDEIEEALPEWLEDLEEQPTSKAAEYQEKEEVGEEAAAWLESLEEETAEIAAPEPTEEAVEAEKLPEFEALEDERAPESVEEIEKEPEPEKIEERVEPEIVEEEYAWTPPAMEEVVEEEPVEPEPLEQKEIPEAEEVVQPTLEEDQLAKKPEEAPSHVDEFEEALEAGRNSLAEGNVKEAMEYYSQLIKRNKYMDDVLEDLKKALEYKYPVNVEIWQTLGDAYMRSDRLQDALNAYTKAEELFR